MPIRLIEVRGTKYYEAAEALQNGRLAPGTSVVLVPRPDNPYDHTAVEIRLLDATMLGHVPRELSAAFFAAVRAGRVNDARIRWAGEVGERVEITVEVELASHAPRVEPPAPAPRPAVRADALRAAPSEPAPVPSPSAPERPRPGAAWFWWLVGGLFVLWLLAH